jgi:hypothetical protein
MLSPQGTIVEACIDYGARISVLKTSHPRKPDRIFTFQKLPERYCAHLLKGVGKIALKILGKMLPFSILDDVTAKLNYLKIRWLFYAVHSFALRILIRLSKCRGADRNQYNCR